MTFFSFTPHLLMRPLCYADAGGLIQTVKRGSPHWDIPGISVGQYVRGGTTTTQGEASIPTTTQPRTQAHG